MKFGYFDDANKEYVITSPKTPLPWINYLGSENFFSLISNTCGGYSFYKDAKLLRLTRYRYNNVPFDSNGHYYYIKEGDTIWNPGWMPAKTDLDAYECHHGMGYSTFRSSKNDLQAELTAFVPVGKNCEINQLTLTNNSKETKDFSVFSYVEFCLWNAMDDMTNFQRNFSTGEVEVHGSAIYHKTEYRERRNHYALYAVNAPVDGFDTDRDSFLGAYGENSAPEVVVSDQSKNSIASGWAPVGSHHLKVSLAPGESKTFVFILAYIENPVEEKWIGRAEDGKINRTRAEALMKEFDTKEKSEAALAELKKYWDELLSHFTVSSSEEKLDRMVNIWHQYQCMVTFNMSRSASYFESGIGRGMGFRDSCQDLLGFVHLIPDRARERILDIAATQFEDGSAYHQYQPLTKKGNSDIGSGFNDDPLWLIAGTAAYIKETGDYTILDEKTPYISVRRAWHVEGGEPVVNTLLKTPAAKRDVPIPKCLVACLKEAREKSESEYVISNSKGTVLTEAQFVRVWKYITVRSTAERCYYTYVNGQSIKHRIKPRLGEHQPNNPKLVYTMDFKVTPHMLRHTYITNLIYKGVDPKTVQYLAGHENSKTTMDIYAKVKYNKPEKLSSVVNAAFGLR